MRVLAVVLAFSLTPGVAEAAQDVAHFLVEGHTLHAAAVQAAAHVGHDRHDEHEQDHDDGEHGCSTLFHVCACHTPTPSLISARLTLDHSHELQRDVARVVFPETRPHADGVARESFRPPIA